MKLIIICILLLFSTNLQASDVRCSIGEHYCSTHEAFVNDFFYYYILPLVVKRVCPIDRAYDSKFQLINEGETSFCNLKIKEVYIIYLTHLFPKEAVDREIKFCSNCESIDFIGVKLYKNESYSDKNIFELNRKVYDFYKVIQRL